MSFTPSRRAFIGAAAIVGGATVASISSVLARNVVAQPDRNTSLLGSYRGRDNRYGTARIDLSGNTLWQLESPARLHQIALHDSQDLGLAIARRPGYLAQLFSISDGSLKQQLSPPVGYLLEGHGLFHNDSVWLTASTEDQSLAVLLKYELRADSDQLTDQPEVIALQGLGPHEMLSVGEHIAVAVGGWHSAGRKILNADNFTSGVVLFNPADGSQQWLGSPNPALSLRHLAVGQTAEQQLTIWAGAQLADPKPSNIALVYQLDAEQQWQALAPPRDGWEIFNGYIGSLAVTEKDVLATSPQGHHYGRWNTSGKFVAQAARLDVAGAASDGDSWWLSTGLGEIVSANGQQQSGLFWDNHWAAHTSKKGDAFI